MSNINIEGEKYVGESERHFIDVEASDNLFEELENNSYDFKDLLSELIDNSIAGKFEEKPVNIEISFFTSDVSGKICGISISDDGRGIPEKRLGKALSLAALQTSGSLNEHGMGMKVAVASLGTLELLSTKTFGSEYALAVERFGFGRIPLEHTDVERESGTEIRIKDPKPKVPDRYVGKDGRSRNKDIKNGISKEIGARYRLLLADDAQSGSSKLAVITLKHFKQGEEQVEDSVQVEPIKPAYEFNRESYSREPTIIGERFTGQTSKGSDWEVELTIGFAADDKERNIPAEWAIFSHPKKGEPYYKAQSNQGLDVIMNNRVIAFAQWANLFDIETHNSYNRIRGELRLIKGFQTTTTKNAIKPSEAWTNARRRIYKRIYPKFIKGPRRKNNNDEENASKDLMDWLEENHQDKEFDHSYHTEGLPGEVDIFNKTDREPWEIKTGTTNWQDVFQLFGYMSFLKCKKGYLVGNRHSQGSKVAIRHINKYYPQFHIEAKSFKKDFSISVPREGLIVY